MPAVAKWSPLTLRLVTLAALAVLWEVLARAYGDPAIVAPPSRVLAAFPATIFGNPKLETALAIGFAEIVVAFVLAIVVGTTAGVAIGISELGRQSLFPIVLLVWGIPQVVLLPLFILVFGIGPPSRIAFGFSHGVLPIVVNTVAGMRNVNPLFLASARTMGASRLQVLRHVIFPNMIGTVFTGLRFAMTLTLLGIVLAELFVSTNGIGNYTQIFANTFKPDKLFALILTLAAGAVALNELVRLVENRFSRWKQDER